METDVPPSDYTVIDVETTGLDACTCDILEIGAIRYRGHKEVERFHTYVRPEGSLRSEAYKINHIAWSRVASAPTLDDVSEEFFRFIEKDVIVGYNVKFDMKFLQTRLGIDIKNDAFDVLRFVKKVKPSLRSYKLSDLRRHFLIIGKAHSALSDCRATAKILEKCLKSSAGQKYQNIAMNLQMEREKQTKAEQKHRQEVLEKKAKVKVPPAKELNLLSKKMTGTPEDYFSKVEEILLNNKVDFNDLKLKRFYDGKYLGISNRSFFGVKSDGRLKYILLDVPIENITCDFVCTPCTMKEGEDSTRIYVSSPDDLESLSEYIIASFQYACKRINTIY